MLRESSDEGSEEDDIFERPPPTPRVCCQHACCKAALCVSAGLWAAALLQALRAAWLLAPPGPEVLPVEADGSTDQSRPDSAPRCPCACAQGTRGRTTTTTTVDLVVVTTTTTTSAVPPDEHSVAARLREEHRGGCREGDVCAYGPGWCTADMALQLDPSGFCTMGKCNGHGAPHAHRGHPRSGATPIRPARTRPP